MATCMIVKSVIQHRDDCRVPYTLRPPQFPCKGILNVTGKIPLQFFIGNSMCRLKVSISGFMQEWPNVAPAWGPWPIVYGL